MVGAVVCLDCHPPADAGLVVALRFEPAAAELMGRLDAVR